MAYISLVLAGFLAVAAGWRRGAARVKAGLFLVTGGAIFLGDLVLTGMMDLYRYHPGLLSGQVDSYLGVVLAESIFLPCLFAALGALPRSVWPWAFGLIALPLMGLEEVFMELGLYTQSGWATAISGMLFFAFGVAIQWWTEAFEQSGYSRTHRAVLVASAVYYAMNLQGLIPDGILRMSEINAGWLADPDRDKVLSHALLRGIPFTTTAFLVVWFRKARHPGYLALVVAEGTVLLGSLWWLGIWQPRWPWNPVAAGLLAALIIYGLGRLDAWFARHDTPT